MINKNNSNSSIGFGSQQASAKLNMAIEDLEGVQCENCKCEIFAEGVMIRTVSALLTGTGKEGIVPIPAMYCIKCQTVVDRLLPEELRSKKIKI